MQPVEWNMPMQVCHAVVLIHYSAPVDEVVSIYVDITMAGRHHLTSETNHREKDFFCSRDYTPRQREVKVEY